MECDICCNEIDENINKLCKANPKHILCVDCKRKNLDMCLNRGHIPKPGCIICNPLSVPIIIDISDDIEVIEREEDDQCCDRIVGDCGFMCICIGFIGLMITATGYSLNE